MGEWETEAGAIFAFTQWSSRQKMFFFAHSGKTTDLFAVFCHMAGLHHH